ncbi:MAG TPA: nucleotide exchange factor GrpE [Bacteroidetes bacterium]|nr:nucleotide exchange factor GrpE [Bacteroidota bacterium]
MVLINNLKKMKQNEKKDIQQDEKALNNQEPPDHEDKTMEQEKHQVQKKHKKTKSEEIAGLKEQLAELNDKYLRLFSDFDNYRKRTNAEKLELIKTASKEVIEGLLPVLDDFERALQNLNERRADDETIKGIELIYNKLFIFLKQKGLEPMESKGTEFNTDFHDAITQIPAPSKDMKGKVVDVVQKGYLLNGSIIRHAKVIVGQ